MTRFKLKKEARQFFEEKFYTENKPFEWWKDYQIPIQLLEEVDRCYINYGHERILPSGTRTSSLCGWDGNKSEAEFRFTLVINDIENKEYEKLEVENLMDEIQKTINSYMKRIL